jgi:DnaJ-class molecular chaperone
MTIEIKPGYDTDKVITFPSKGNEAFAYHQSKLNIHFALSNEDVNGVVINNSYVRHGDNLIYTHELSLEDALLSKPI